MTQGEYEPDRIEPKWQERWEQCGLFKTPRTSPKKPKLYCLAMFPYPSGDGLHVGHARIYIAPDVLARYFRARGYSVLHPMGWDAFGLPAENDAIRNKQNPNERVPKNVANFKRQMKMLALSYDWEREITTCDPAYYKWTQWLFLKLYERGLVYQSLVPINWCPSCKTGLADEEAVGGKCDRCGAAVTKKDMKQWLLRITNYADRLLYDLDKESLDWPEGIVKMQKDWIGRSEGAEVDFGVAGHNNISISVFTTRIDTIFGVTAIVLAPEHPLIKNSHLRISREQNRGVQDYVEASKNKSELERTDLAKEKTGIFTGCFAVNPASGTRVPIWVSDYVIGTYGGGAVMVVPAHDQRDYDFAKKFGLEVRQVISGGLEVELPHEGDGLLMNSGEFNNQPSGVASKAITEQLVEREYARPAVHYKMRDWVFSRQRYWGEPMPLVHCAKCGVVPVPYEDLPVLLPYVEAYEPTGTGASPLAAITEWVNTVCPKCGGSAKRETDTMPNWAGSSWYFLRFTDTQNDKEPFSEAEVKKWLPVDWYLGGAEHAVLHLLYARFWVKAFSDIGLLDFKEPFKRLRGVGMVLAEDGRKMSKSWHNVINPDDVVTKFGCDALRLHEMFMGPWEHAIPWSTKGVAGCSRFLNKVWRLFAAVDDDYHTPESLGKALAVLVKKVSGDIEAVKFNTAVAAMMEFIGQVQEDDNNLGKDDWKVFLKLLSPFAPHITEELWQMINGSDKDKFVREHSIHVQPWPKFNADLVAEKEVTIIVCVNGKRRGKLTMPVGVGESEVISAALKLAGVQKHLQGKEIKRTIFAPDKLVNFVV